MAFFLTLLLAVMPVAAGERLCGCGVSVPVPNGWIGEATETAAGCRIRLRPRNWDQKVGADDVDHAWTIDLAPRELSFRAAAEEYGFRESDDDGWASELSAKASPIEHRHWSGILAIDSDIRGYGKGGPGYIGVSQADLALISDRSGERSVFVVSDIKVRKTMRLVLRGLGWSCGRPSRSGA